MLLRINKMTKNSVKYFLLLKNWEGEPIKEIENRIMIFTPKTLKTAEEI
jgi:hypothetical protein